MIDLKLCGNHSIEDLKLATKSRANYIGIIFAESKRKVSPSVLAEWLKEVHLPEHKQLVGVFVNPTIDVIENVRMYIPLDIVQLHGNETIEFIKKLKSVVALPIFKAIHHQPPVSYQLMEQLASLVDGFVVDSKVKGAWGGTGIKFAWEAIPTYVEISQRLNKKCFIAGGIKPDNVQECLTFAPPGIDLSSGIETNGRKDQQLITQLEERIILYEQNLSRH
jgi:phosphoribosylanthranilate isomerase